MMRALIILPVLLFAAPVVAQPSRDLVYGDLILAQDAQRAAEAQALRNRDIALTNELAVTQARAGTDQALSDIAAASVRPTVPTVAFNPAAPPPKIDPSQLAEIPDSVLAASNARIRAAADNRR
jgi:hypothetical protein